MSNDNEWKYPVCVILYKEDNTPGWLMAKKAGEKAECEKFCKELKKQHKITAFKCYVDSWNRYKENTPMQKFFPLADDLHMRTDIIWNTYEDKFYEPNEYIPYPKKSARKTNVFYIDAKVEPETDKEGLLDEFEEEDDFDYISGILYFNKKISIMVDVKPVMIDIPKFLRRLEKTGYSNLIIEEYWYTKFLAWEKDDKVRFIIQSYGNSDVDVLFDKIIDRDLFFNELKKLHDILNKKLLRAKRLHKKFQEEEIFLKKLPWKLYTNCSDTVQDIILLNSEELKTKKFMDFIEKVRKKSVKHTIDFDTWETDHCLHIGDYYYKVKGNMLIRYFYLDSKNTEILRYIKLYNIQPGQYKNVSDLYDDVVKHSGREAIDCYLGKEKVTIFEDGGIRAPKSSEVDKEKLRSTIKSIFSEVGKSKLSVDDFVRLLQTHSVRVSSFRSERVMSIREVRR